MPAPFKRDAVVIGGGFYGSTIAIYLARQRGLKSVLLVERESALLARASYHNQARVHNGYHYPRSFTTAYRSRINLPSFVREWPEAVRKDFTKLYAIARYNSKVTAKQFLRFCRDIEAKIEPADMSLRQLFDPRLIEDVFLVQEYAFDATKLASWTRSELEKSGVEVLCGTSVSSIFRGSDGSLNISTTSGGAAGQDYSCRYLFNCTYSGLNQFSGDFPGTKNLLKQEIAELALMSVPNELRGVGVTVMDGPFFSLMPFPARDLHTLSHVRYTPHAHWNDRQGLDPYRRVHDQQLASRVDRMRRDAGRYLPAILDARYVESLFEVKTVLLKNEGDDGRPILFEKHVGLPGLYSVLGGKIDNIFDVLEKLNGEDF